MPRITKDGCGRVRGSCSHREHESPRDGRQVEFKFKGKTGRAIEDLRITRPQGFCTKHIKKIIKTLPGDGKMPSAVSDLRVVRKQPTQLPCSKRDKGQRRLKCVPSCFYRVEIRGGSRFTKEYLLNVIANHIKPMPLVPLKPEMVGDDFVFSVEDHPTAEKIMLLNRMITLSNGWKIILSVRWYTPIVEVDEKLTSAIKTALSSRFLVATKALDLTQFHLDPAFISQDLLCALNLPDVMTYVLGLIADSVQDLAALSLSKNNILATDHLGVMVEKFPSLKVLHMTHNYLRDVKQLDPLKGLKLEELNLEGNPLRETCALVFHDQSAYISEVQKRFPLVIRLDGINLPKPITFDLDIAEEISLPKSQLIFACEAVRGEPIARMFITQYFQAFDLEDRAPLVEAYYHEQAQLSITCSLSPADTNSQFDAYLTNNRNLFRVNNPVRRIKLLKMGKHSIVHALKSFPNTAHDPSTFVIDLVFFTPELIQLMVGGVYREKNNYNSSGSPVKYFNRVLVIVPTGSGFRIVNEQLSILYPTAAQINGQNSKPREATPSSLPLGQDMLTKQRMVADLAGKSGMNLVWSERCLMETNWDPDVALFAFMQLRDSGAIPLEAFLN